MPTDSCVYARLKEFKFRLEINGLPAALIQDFNPGDRSVGVSEHAGAGQNHACKEAGFMKFGPATLKYVVPLEGAGRLYFDMWMDMAQDPMTGNGLPPSAYIKTMSFYELGPEGNPVRVFEYYRAFPSKIVPGNRHSLEENKDVIEEVEIAYTRREIRAL